MKLKPSCCTSAHDMSFSLRNGNVRYFRLSATSESTLCPENLTSVTCPVGRVCSHKMYICTFGFVLNTVESSACPHLFSSRSCHFYTCCRTASGDNLPSLHDFHAQVSLDRKIRRNSLLRFYWADVNGVTACTLQKTSYLMH